MPRVVPAVNRALDILELFLDRTELSAREVIERLDLPRTTVHELLVTLEARSYLVAVPGQPVRYRLGMPLFELGAAFAGRVDLDAVLGRGVLRGMTPASITDPERLRTHPDQVRADGMAVDVGESDSAMRCVAAAVRDHSGAVIAAMSLSAPIIRWTPQAQEKWPELVRDGAAVLSARMGAR